MIITNIKIRRILERNRLKAFVSVTFNGIFVVHDLKIIRGEDRYFLAMPSAWTVVDENGADRDIYHPVTMKFRQYLEEEVLKSYFEELEKQNADEIHKKEANEAPPAK